MSVRAMNRLAALCMALALLTIGGAALTWFAQQPKFQLKRVDVLGDLRHVTAASVRTALAGRLHGNYFTLRLDDTHCLVAESTGCPHLVLHIPASSGLVPEYLCLEPVTLLPGALNRERANERVANIGLAPGDVRTMSWRCRVANG